MLLYTIHSYQINMKLCSLGSCHSLGKSSSDFSKTSQTTTPFTSRCTMRYKKNEITRRTKSMNPGNIKTNSNNTMHDLSLCGIAIDRTRRMTQKMTILPTHLMSKRQIFLVASISSQSTHLIRYVL